MIGFLHIPRTGGSYLESAVFPALGKNFVNFFGVPLSDQLDNRVDLIEMIATNGEVQNQLRAVIPSIERCTLFSGHFSLNLTSFLPIPEIQYVTILRHPIHRVASFAAKVTTSLAFRRYIFNEDVKDTEFTENAWRRFHRYIQEDLTVGLMQHERHGFCNYMTKALAGCDLSGPIEVNEQTLTEATKNLDQMALVGIFEKYKESVMRIQGILGINIPFEPVPETFREIPPDIATELLSLNRFDEQLYMYACERFNK